MAPWHFSVTTYGPASGSTRTRKIQRNSLVKLMKNRGCRHYRGDRWGCICKNLTLQSNDVAASTWTPKSPEKSSTNLTRSNELRLPNSHKPTTNRSAAHPPATRESGIESQLHARPQLDRTEINETQGV